MVDTRIVRMTAGLEGIPDRFTVSHVIPPGAAEPSRDVMEEMLRHLSFSPQFHIYEFGTTYNFADEDRPDPASFPHNTLVEVALPYCLHVPRHFAVEVPIGNPAQLAVAVFTKVWTLAAAGSDETDLYADDRITYVAPITFQTPNFPERSQLGPDPPFTGHNLERDRDTKGYFRYSLLRIFFDTNYGDLNIAAPAVVERAKQECIEITLGLVNRIIDVYRLVTGEDHVQRLGSVHIPNLYFVTSNLGMYGVALGHGIRSAVMNRSNQELEEIAQLLRSGNELPIIDLLFLDAEAALHSGQYVLTVVHAFQALELFLEEFLERRLRVAGFDAAAVAERLDRCWRTKERLRNLLHDATGHSLTEHGGLWDRFCTVYDQVRNRLIHSAAEIDKQRAAECLQVCRDVVAWVKTL